MPRRAPSRKRVETVGVLGALSSNKHPPCFDSSFSSLIMAAYPDLTVFALSSSFLFVRLLIFSKSSANVQATCAVWQYLKTKHSQQSPTPK